MRNFLMTAALAAALSAPRTAEAAWIAMSGVNPAEPGILATGQKDSFALDVTVPGIDVQVEGGYTHLRIPGHPKSMRKGEPELPVLTTSILLPETGTPRATLKVIEETTLPLSAKVVPSFGHVTRDIPLSSLKREESAVYTQAGDYPAEGFTVSVGSPFILRDVRGASLRINPVVYSPSKGEVRILRKARLEVSIEAGANGINPLEAPVTSIDADFAPLYRSLFVNAEVSGIGGEDLDEHVGRAIVIVPDQWIANLQPLLDWRAAKGLETKVLAMSQVGEGTAAIRTAIQAEYEAGNLTYVLLVGDGDALPPPQGENESADCDACFVKLAGDDHVPDAIISRFSAKTAADVDVQVARAVKYEKEPITDEAANGFYRQATGIASNEGYPKDRERMDILREAELAYHYDAVDQIYDTDEGYASAQAVTDAVNAGRALINYMGHGSKTDWVTSGFGVSEIQSGLTNTTAWPMIWSVACVNGDFVNGSDCFGEAWAKAGTAEAPKGAIGIVAASTNMAWDPPVDWQRNAVKEYMIGEKVFTGGAMHHYGLVKSLEQWGSDASSDGVQMIEQCIYFGDASVVIRNDRPRAATVTAKKVDDGCLMVDVSAGGAAVRAARIVVRAGDQTAVKVTGPSGAVTFPAALVAAGDITVTVTGPNLVPVVGQAVAAN